MCVTENLMCWALSIVFVQYSVIDWNPPPLPPLCLNPSDQISLSETWNRSVSDDGLKRSYQSS